jgi:hypothetical protein
MLPHSARLVVNWEGIGQGLNQMSLCTHRHQITLDRPTQEVVWRSAADHLFTATNNVGNTARQ